MIPIYIGRTNEYIRGKGRSCIEILVENNMLDPIMASPAISDNMLFFRTQHYLAAVGK